LATAPFLHTVGDLGLCAISRLKGNLPELYQTAQRRLPSAIPTGVFPCGKDRVEVWDAQDFDPWTSLRWETVRVIFYRQNKSDGTVVEAYWLTDFSIQEVDSQALFGMAKSRWTIENQGFNEAKNLHGLEHLCHHHPNSMLVVWLLTALAMTVDRLYRHRYLHRRTHRILTPIDLVRILEPTWRFACKPIPVEDYSPPPASFSRPSPALFDNSFGTQRLAKSGHFMC
jgi:hypothetical protein